MGLLDDAIREHIELKRLRGAEPGVLALEEQDALGPVRREEDAYPPTAGDGVASSGEIAPEDAAFGEDDASRTSQPQPAAGSDFANVGQETAELDMRTVLGGEQGTSEETAELVDDTPEQEHLWLEQGSPRDPDFSE